MYETHLICASTQMVEIADTIKMSRGRALLLTGETGVGKDALARWAHSISPFVEGPFVDINCAAIQEQLWESEIFGHTKGAFTGATEEKTGQVETARDGTLFLNEIGEMPLPTQAKLLTFLDTHQFQRVGSTEKRSVETRVIAATNRDLASAIETGSFRQDLFYRLAEVHVPIPPLRERSADVLAIANQFLQALSRERSLPVIGLADDAQELLLNAQWRGNVRELRAVLLTGFERCVRAEERMLQDKHFTLEIASLQTKEDSEEEPGVDSAHSNLSAKPTLGNGHSPSALPHPNRPESTILDNQEELESYLDQFLTESGRWNISAAYRRLVQHGITNMSRHSFSRRVKSMFPDR